MKLYGHHISVTTLQALLVLSEKKLSASLELVDVFCQAHKKPSFLTLHPFGHIPVLQESDFSLFETHAILRYLDTIGEGTSLIPDAPRARARMDQWMCIEQNYLLPAAKKVMSRGYAKMMKLPDPGEAVVTEGLRELDKCLAQFRSYMESREYIAGPTFTLADLVWAADLHDMKASIPNVRVEIEQEIETWLDKITARTCWETAIKTRASMEPDEAI